MKQYILIYKGEGAKPPGDVKLIRNLPRTTVIDDSPSQMVLVKAPKSELRTFVDSLPEWGVTPMRVYSVPETRPRLLRGSMLRGAAKQEVYKKTARRRVVPKSKMASSE